MTQVEYVNLLNQQRDTLEKIIDITERQIRFLRGKHRSLGGLTRLLEARTQLLKQLAALTEKCRVGQEWQNSDGIQEVMQQLQHRKAKIRELQRQAIEAAQAEQTRIGGHISAGRVTQNIRQVYIGRWYQGVSRGFSRTV